MKIFQNKKTRVLIYVMSALFICAVISAHFYYKYQNQSVDPRVVEANFLYAKYNDLSAISDYEGIFKLMDSIEAIYTPLPHYAKSYEVGVLYNNRAASYIAMAILPATADSTKKDSLLGLAQINAQKSIELYSNWLIEWEGKSIEQIKTKLSPFFRKDDKAFEGNNTERYINKRAKQIIESQFETPRRLSVSHTNLGIIFRHKKMYDEAVNEYLKALELWPDNLAAENNLSILLGKPLKKKGVLRHIFPKDRTKKF